MQGFEGKFVKLTMAQDVNGKPYEDDRKQYVGRSGLLIFCKSDEKNPGKMYLRFVTFINDQEAVKFTTSYGTKTEAPNAVQFKTKNSVYVFTTANDLSKEDKKRLLDFVGKTVNMIS